MQSVSNKPHRRLWTEQNTLPTEVRTGTHSVRLPRNQISDRYIDMYVYISGQCFSNTCLH